jgi:hypothetical protein
MSGLRVRLGPSDDALRAGGVITESEHAARNNTDTHATLVAARSAIEEVAIESPNPGKRRFSRVQRDLEDDTSIAAGRGKRQAHPPLPASAAARDVPARRDVERIHIMEMALV